MSEIESKVKAIIVDKLGEVSQMIWAQIHWIP